MNFELALQCALEITFWSSFPKLAEVPVSGSPGRADAPAT